MKTDPIILQVVAKMLQRSSTGIEKYGTTLAENNTDDFLLHLQEELLDAAAYIEKLMQQRDNPPIKWTLGPGTLGVLPDDISMPNSTTTKWVNLPPHTISYTNTDKYDAN